MVVMTKDLQHEVQTITKVEHRIILKEKDILAWLRKRGEVPIDAKDLHMSITVPSGGDYSGDVLSVDEVEGVVVTFSTVTRE
jgi:hypothetical protein